MSPRPTGRRGTRGEQDRLVLERTFAAPVEAVWAAVTESERLARWIGTWTGDPATGSVALLMNAEGDDVRPQTFTILACEPPRLLELTAGAEGGEEGWHLLLELDEHDGSTTLTFSQFVSDAETAAGVGPGWEYYLDRLVAAETGGDVAAVDFDDYHPAQGDHYRSLFA
ncbi:SRPBCC family protein [Nocardioides solisilvae]|uniref:SRPBCC family protein n=1 Tax=Nocardioides solisilvae TaxID=1542435 RepID=UPI000D7503DB|nr:SRPBCC family protein [Nocardioides solisilvae]